MQKIRVKRKNSELLSEDYLRDLFRLEGGSEKIVEGKKEEKEITNSVESRVNEME